MYFNIVKTIGVNGINYYRKFYDTLYEFISDKIIPMVFTRSNDDHEENLNIQLKIKLGISLSNSPTLL